MRKIYTVAKVLQPSLAEVGKIKIGMKGRQTTSRGGKTFQQPVKLDHFRVTTMERGQDGNFKLDQHVHQLYGDTPRELPVQLLFDDPTLNFQTRLACFNGRSLWCNGDGETASRQVSANQWDQVDCPCNHYLKASNCKLNGKLSVLIEGADIVGGVWTFRTTGYNSCNAIMSSMAMIQQVTRGPLAGIPLWLRVSPRGATTPDGKQQTIYVVSLEYRGSVSELREIGLAARKELVDHGVQMQQIEHHARQLAEAPDAPDLMGEPEDAVDEWYPEQAVAEDAGVTGPEPVTIQQPLQEDPVEEQQAPEPEPEPEAGAQDLEDARRRDEWIERECKDRGFDANDVWKFLSYSAGQQEGDVTSGDLLDILMGLDKPNQATFWRGFQVYTAQHNATPKESKPAPSKVEQPPPANTEPIKPAAPSVPSEPSGFWAEHKNWINCRSAERLEAMVEEHKMDLPGLDLATVAKLKAKIVRQGAKVPTWFPEVPRVLTSKQSRLWADAGDKPWEALLGRSAAPKPETKGSPLGDVSDATMADLDDLIDKYPDFYTQAIDTLGPPNDEADYQNIINYVLAQVDGNA
jgi:hypothetical protein